jgi:Do/DeqQ family serine protease
MIDSRRFFLVLVGISLVLTGLLGGILFMLVVNDGGDGSSMRRVERVQLTRAEPSEARPASDTAEMRVPEPSVLNALFRNVADQVTPAVVFIEVRTGDGDARLRQFDGDMRDFFRNPPVPRRSVGSGVLINSKGYIVTNNHVVENAESINVTMADKRQFEATVIGNDPSTDIAVIKVETDAPLPSVPLADSDRLRVGDWVVAVGNPFRLTSTVTTGIVSALGRQVNIIDNSFRIENFIQTDAAINPGNSGGALVNMSGALVGINTAIATESGSYEGYGFAVPANLVERVVSDLIAYGDVRRGFLGVSIQEVNADVAGEIGLGTIRGVYVADVRTGSAADEAGIEAGDVVIQIEGADVDSPGELQSAVAQFRPGDQISVTVWRDGVKRALQPRLMGRDAIAYQEWTQEMQPGNEPPRDEPENEAPSDDRPSDDDPSEAPPESSGSQILEIDAWGVGLTPLSDLQREDFGVDAGAFVAFVEGDGAAAAAGMPRGVVITHVNDTPVDSPEAVRRAIDATTEPALVQLRRRNGTHAFYEVR